MAEQDPLDQHLYDDQQDSDGRSDRSAGGEGKNEQQQSSSQSQSKGQGGSGGQPQEQQEGGQEDGAPKPSPLTPSEQEQLRVQWQQRLAGAAQQARQAGKLGAGMARMIEFFLEPELPWRVLLARYLTSVARDDYSYLRPSNRRGDPFIFPSLRSAQIDMVVAVDVSGSVSEKEIGQFIAEIDALKGQLRSRITLHACDSNLVAEGPWYFEPWEEFSMPKHLQGGGGTSFKPIFDWVDTEDRPPDLLVYFTDAQGEFPDLPPQYPVVWLVKGKTKVPWGERVQLN
jgi:predicted metal-dependent peptidase